MKQIILYFNRHEIRFIVEDYAYNLGFKHKKYQTAWIGLYKEDLDKNGVVYWSSVIW